MKRSLSFILSLVMVIGIITCVPLTVNAAGIDDLTFELNDDGVSYSVADCDTSASGELVIPTTYNGLPVTSIGRWAFEDCTSLTSITIPDSVTSIGGDAFYNCTSLTSVAIPDSVTYIGDGSFDNTGYFNDSSNWENGALYIGNHLIRVKETVSGKYEVKKGTKTIAYRAFQGCSCVTSIIIPNGVKSIGYGAFINCEKLTSIVIPDSVTYIGAFAFYLCKNLVSVKLSEQMTEIPDYLFYKSPSIKKIVIPLGVTSIGYCAFARCTGLETVEIPSSVTSLGACAFEGCTGLKEINVDPKNEKFSSIDGVFFNKKQDVLKIFPASHTKTEYKIPDTVTEIAYSSFCGASSLSKVSIPSSVKSIGGYAFTNCRSLKSVTIPESVTSVWYMAFGYHFDWLAYGEVNKAPDFTIYGIKGSAGETYANENEFKFIEVKKPAQPTLKKVYNENSYVRVTWRAVKGADLYRVYRMVSGGEYEYIGSATDTSYTDKKAPAGKTCRYKIKAKNIAGYSDYSASIAIKHIDEPKLKSIENSAYGVLIKWDKVTGAEKYNVYRKVSGGEYKYIGATSKIYYTDKTAKSGTKYYYAIRGKRDDSVSSQSASLSKYYLEDPTLNAPTTTSKGVGLKWSEVAGAEGYVIYRKTGSSGSYKKIATEKGVSNLFYRDTTAKKGTKYYYKVKAYKSKTYSAYSNTKAITDKY